MAGYVIHLAVAEEYLRNHKDKKEDYNEFIEGIIYPDSVKDKSETHYGDISANTNLCEFLKNRKIDNSFNRGYFLHLLTDYLFYNHYISCISKDIYNNYDIYNDYDILNKQLIEKYNLVIPEKIKDFITYKEGELKVLSEKLIDNVINDISKMDIDQIAKEIEEGTDKWTIYRRMNEIIYPDYNHCILNTITSILKHYNVGTNHASLESLDKILEKRYKNIVFVVLDGLGEYLLENLSPNSYFSKNKIDCVTSVYPSTTTAALTTYYSGKPPYETGWIAWSQYFKEYGRAIDMLPHQESYLKEDISNAKMNVFDTLVNYKTVFEQIEEASKDVKAYEIMPTYSDKKSKRSLRADNIDELVDGIQTLCELSGEKFILAYSDNPDNLLHKFGTKSEEVRNFIKSTENKIENMCKKLSEDTIVIISADHGHKDIEKAYSLLDYPELQECLYMPVSLESRAVSFCVKEGMKKIFEERFNNIFRDEFLLMTRKEFLDRKFLGFGEKHPKIDEFLGNYIALSVSSSIIKIETFLADGKPVKKSTHCGLSDEEMAVPVIAIDNRK